MELMPTFNHAPMRELVLIVLDLFGQLATMIGCAGIKAVVAENLMLKHQLLVIGRTRRCAPPLLIDCCWDS